ncbi:MAG: hypothetical protein ABIN69_11885 [Aestuariivirga sp.]
MKRTAGIPRFNDRDLLFCFVSALAVFVCWGRLSFFTQGQPLVYLLQSREGVGIGEVIAFVALFNLASQLPNSEVLKPSQHLALTIASLAFLVPSFAALLIPVAVATTVLLKTPNPILRSMGQIFLAMLFFEAIGQVIFIAIAPYVLNLETLAVQEVMSWFWQITRNGPAIEVVGGQNIYLGVGCSAFHNLSLAALLWISLRKIESTRPFLVADWLILLAMALVTIILNTVRIAYMAHSKVDFDYWHDGNGSNHIAFVMLAAMLGTFLIGRMIAAPK